METALFSAASLFHGADSDDDRGRPSKATRFPLSHLSSVARRVLLMAGAIFLCGIEDEMQVGAEGEKQALQYVEREHDFPDMKLNSILDGQRILELGSGTGALAIFLRKAFGVDMTTSDYDDKDIEENIAYNCRANNLEVLPHIRHTWGDPFPISRPDWDIIIASDILLYVKQYENLVKTVSFLLKEYTQSGEKAGVTTITDKSGTQVPAKSPMFLMSWRRRIGKDQSLFFTGCEKAGLEVQHLGDLVYLINNRS
ncbi:hypothetical protein ACP70R_025755 [Stipagrostis hirtigluma subsp. patula]